MTTIIYYFSGTGNSVAIARGITRRTNGTLIPIASVVDNKPIKPDADVIGIVFPVYHASFGESGIPLIVRRFVGKLEGIASKYLFAICTHGGMPGATIGNLAAAIESRGGELSAGFAIRMSISYSAIQKIGHAFFNKELETDIDADDRKRQILFARAERKLDIIQSIIDDRKKAKLETFSGFARFVLAPLFLLQKQAAVSRFRDLSKSSSDSYDELTMLADISFLLNDRCNGCGVCTKICPVHNIKMVNKKPVWQHRCENCYACFQWCPKDAIHGKMVEYQNKYHHPDVKVSDMIRRT
jgi:ferredoxin/flavodoxin